ncbi:hypothetical protein LAP9571_03047 [Lactiplantibacillus plantarum]|nr:universal stress protein [Lactiplantibacillus plantarum]VFI64134.1 hypothetical protein LAP9571_03047 [Lactiplantibacillus plantarum]VFI64268.1 hypothetical protein LAP9492_03045 [Lactiplantibacillus plantarum]
MSITFKRILVGVDDSADAKLAFKHAINEAIQYETETVLMNKIHQHQIS